MHFLPGSKKDQKDLENGNETKVTFEDANGQSDASDKLDEYGNLVRYIATYRENRRMSVAPQDDDEDQSAKVKWYTPWKRWTGAGKTAPGADFETPDEWLLTDLKQGLSTAEVEKRRRYTGWNELTTEKENLFIKFLTFFTGPILYGK